MSGRTAAGDYSFGRVVVQASVRRLVVDGKPCAVGARAFDVLMALVDRRDRVVPKGDLIDAVWPGLVVEENNLQVHISALRKALGPSAIATVPGRGYQFTLAADNADSPPKSGAQAPTAAAIPGNLPQMLTSFIGRERELGQVREMLVRTRLLTLTGAGGCGKSRLAIEAVAGLAAAYPDGVWLVELAGLADPGRTAQAAGSLAPRSTSPLTPRTPSALTSRAGAERA